MQEMRVCCLGQEDLLEEEMTTHSSILAWKISWTEETGRLQSIASQRVRHDLATTTQLSDNNTSQGKRYLGKFLKETELVIEWYKEVKKLCGIWSRVHSKPRKLHCTQYLEFLFSYAEVILYIDFDFSITFPRVFITHLLCSVKPPPTQSCLPPYWKHHSKWAP